MRGDGASAVFPDMYTVPNTVAINATNPQIINEKNFRESRKTLDEESESDEPEKHTAN